MRQGPVRKTPGVQFPFVALYTSSGILERKLAAIPVLTDVTSDLLIKDEERKGHVKVPFLGDIPVVGKLFSSSDEGTIKTDILMSITPNIVRTVEVPEKDIQSFWSGTEEGYDTKPLFVTSEAKSSKPSDKTAGKMAVLESMAKRETPVPATTGPAKAESPAAGEPSPAAVLQLTPAETVSPVGQEGKFELTVDNVRDLYGAIITLSYDPKIIEFKTASEGPLLKKDGQQTSFLFSNNIKAGTVDIYITRIGDVGGVDGPGSLCTAVFQGKSGGTSDVAVRSVKLTNFSREQLKTDVKNAKMTVK